MKTFSKKAALSGMVAASALAMGLALGVATPAMAETCLLDTNDDGNADENVDTTGGADDGSILETTKLACGPGASATAAFATGVGPTANASGSGSTALGFGSIASQTGATALGRSSSRWRSFYRRYRQRWRPGVGRPVGGGRRRRQDNRRRGHRGRE